MQDKTINNALHQLHREYMNAPNREGAKLVLALMKLRGVKPVFRRRSGPRGTRLEQRARRIGGLGAS